MFLKLAKLGHPDMWQCATCKVGMGDLALRWEQTGKIVAESSVKLEKIEAEVERQELRNGNLENELKKTKNELEELKDRMEGMKKEAVELSLIEISEREDNSNNVVIYNVPE